MVALAFLTVTAPPNTHPATATSTAPKPATTSDKPAYHEGKDLLLEYQLRAATSWDARFTIAAEVLG